MDFRITYISCLVENTWAKEILNWNEPSREVWEVRSTELELSGAYLDLRKNAWIKRVEVNNQKPRRQTQHWVAIMYSAPRHEERTSTSQIRVSGSLSEDERLSLFPPMSARYPDSGPGCRFLGMLISVSRLSSPGTWEWAPSPRAWRPKRMQDKVVHTLGPEFF